MPHQAESTAGKPAPLHHRITAQSLRLGVLLALTGGFLDAYTFVGRHGVFANSQTGNLVLLAIEAAHGDRLQALRHLPPILAFVLGVAVAETLQLPRIAQALRWPLRASLLLEMAVLLIVGALPGDTPDGLVVIAIAFVASVQISTFRRLGEWQYNTAMTTGNLRTAVEAAYLALVNHDAGERIKALRFGAVIAGFFGGAVAGSLGAHWLGDRAAWLACLPLAAALALFYVDERPDQSAAD